MNFSKTITSIIVFLLCSMLFVQNSYGQRNSKNHRNYRKNSKEFYAKKYAKNYVRADKQCNSLKKKKFNQKNRKVAKRATKKSKPVLLAEVDYNDTPPPPASKPKPEPKPKTVAESKPEPKPKPVAKNTNERDIDNMNEEEKHLVEDIVLLENNLPAPTSEKHEEVRKEVEKHLKNFDKEKPIKLEPLYFVTGQDEFAFVDMDPFLVAVEYALQGKHILIEGHTDHVGDFEANVALSIKRVEKIRDLMIQMGVHDDHISVVGYGEEHSESSTSTEQKQEERRVDFTVF